jgi:DNA-binding response OmpR family regulator
MEKKLLILVDDNRLNLHIGRNVLTGKYAVLTAFSAKALFSILDKIYPVLILLDVDMPEMNGFEAIKILKSNPETKDIPVIFLTSRTEVRDRFKGLSLGAVDYITKPYEPSLLIESIETHLETASC